MFKYLIPTALCVVGTVSLLTGFREDVAGGYGRDMAVRSPYAYQYQRSPTLSRANPYPYQSGWEGGGTVVVPEYAPPPSNQGPYAPPQGGPGAYYPPQGQYYPPPPGQ
ncbi:MAG: hypothetical protein JSR46_05615 [Verrucomicrobia bacterium]|nr:hypothetical protein [Verrucomicrobiota bacterium]